MDTTPKLKIPLIVLPREFFSFWGHEVTNDDNKINGPFELFSSQFSLLEGDCTELDIYERACIDYELLTDSSIMVICELVAALVEIGLFRNSARN